MLAIIKKELKNYFLTPIGYVVIGIFLMAFSAFFLYYVDVLSAYGDSVGLDYVFYYTAEFGLMFIAPLLTMWTISGERKSGTEQLIMTSPVSMFGVIMGKFISAMILILIPVLCTLMYFGILCHYQIPEIPVYLTSMLGFILLSMSYISFGILASSLTESPIISGILTFGLVFASALLPDLISSLSDFSLISLFINFLYGQISITSLVLYITLTILCLTIAMVIMQRRKSIK